VKPWKDPTNLVAFEKDERSCYYEIGLTEDSSVNTGSSVDFTDRAGGTCE